MEKIIDEAAAAAAAAAAAQEAGSSGEEQEKDNQKSEPQLQAEDLIEVLSDETSNDDNDFKNNLPTMDNTILSWMVHLLSCSGGIFRESTKASNKKKIEQWLQSPRAQRPFVMMKNNDMKKLARERGIKFPSNANKVELAQLLAEGNNAQNNNDAVQNLPELSPLIAIIRHSFLRPQREPERSAAKTGHTNEEPFLEKFWNLLEAKEFDCVDDVVPFHLSAVFRPGLVAKKDDNKTFIKDSADGVVVFTDSNVSAACVTIGLEIVLY